MTTFTLHPKTLAALFRAVSLCASTDKTHPTLRHILVTGERSAVLVATDGTCLIRVVLGEQSTTGLVPGLYAPKESIARLKAGGAPVPSQEYKAETFPQYDRVIPELRTSDAPVPPCHPRFDPALLARVMDAVDGALTDARETAVRIQLGDSALSPMRLDAKGFVGNDAHDALVTAVVMPVRA